MKDTLQTLSCKTDNNHIFEVHWLKNDQHGCLQIELHTKEQKDQHIIAEMFAIHHLVVNREVCGNNRYGNNLVLAVSSGAIKKICLGKSTKTHLDAWSGTLKLRLRDADIKVINTRDWINKPPVTQEIIHIHTPPIETHFMHGVGQVALTEHVLDRFYERNLNSSYKNAMKKLIEMLADTGLQRVVLPDRVLLHKKMKYPNHHHTRYFYNPRTNWQFVVDTRPNRLPVVMTAYPLNPTSTYREVLPTTTQSESISNKLINA